MANQLIRRLMDALPATQTRTNREALKKNLTLEIPSDLANPLLDYVLERTYLEELSAQSVFLREDNPADRRFVVEWIRLDRLPVPPGDNDQYDLLSRWQSVLASLHAWRKRVLFLLMRRRGVTRIYLGMVTPRGRQDVHRFHTSLINNMPGVKVTELDKAETTEIANEFLDYRCSGAVTGIPSFRKNTRYSVLQTLDQIAFGVRNREGKGKYSDADFSLLVTADPLDDGQITDVISRFRRLGSEVHTQVRQTLDETESTGRSMGANVGIGALLAMVVKCTTGVTAPLLGKASGTFLAGGDRMEQMLGGTLGVYATQNIGFSRSVRREYLNKFAEYTERMADMHCRRLQDGRNLGFWNTGVYVLAPNRDDVTTVLGMLRSVYSGDETYLEPIRLHEFGGNDAALDIIRRGGLVPILNPDLPGAKEMVNDEWHMLGRPYQYASTPLNTVELSLATSLPRKDVPGIRLVRNAVRFANNSGAVGGGERSFELGRIKDTGVIQSNSYVMGIDSLVRHALVTGGTGCGKTTTCRKIVSKVMADKVPVLIIEPAKDEWARWAVEQSNAGRPVKLFMPGVETLAGMRVSPLKLNPFQPGCKKGCAVDMMTRCEQLIAIVNASLPVSDVLPVLIDESFFTYLKEKIGPDFMKPAMHPPDEFPTLDGILPYARDILHARGYEPRVEQGLTAALDTRFSYLIRGKRGGVLNVRRSTPWEELFGRTTVVNLSRFSNPADRSLIMALLMLSLREYRQSVYENDPDYRVHQAKGNPLAHFTVVEEAHTVLARPSERAGGAQSAAADLFGNLLSEIRGFGEGMMIVDQVPTRLIPDVIKNTNYKIAHRMAAPDDCAVMAAALALRPDQAGMLPMLEQGEAIVQCDRDDAASWVSIDREEA